eukprot:m.16186 g.16186  ORF g.16186 m.16186 type:complete len:307 (+) comp5608_c0_seq1:379-1299(+)
MSEVICHGGDSQTPANSETAKKAHMDNSMQNKAIHHTAKLPVKENCVVPIIAPRKSGMALGAGKAAKEHTLEPKLNSFIQEKEKEKDEEDKKRKRQKPAKRKPPQHIEMRPKSQRVAAVVAKKKSELLLKDDEEEDYETNCEHRAKRRCSPAITPPAPPPTSQLYTQAESDQEREEFKNSKLLPDNLSEEQRANMADSTIDKISRLFNQDELKKDKDQWKEVMKLKGGNLTRYEHSCLMARRRKVKRCFYSKQSRDKAKQDRDEFEKEKKEMEEELKSKNKKIMELQEQVENLKNQLGPAYHHRYN